MTEYNGSIQNVLQGVSQQSRLERRPEQLETQVNCMSSVTKGLGNRPGTQMLATGIAADYPDDAAFHVYDRGDTIERYSMVVTDGDIEVTDLYSGEAKVEVLGSHGTYLASSDPKADFRFHTIADTTFILNRSISPIMDTPTADGSIWQSLIKCRRASWGFEYSIVIDGAVKAKCSTPQTVTLELTSTTSEQSKNITLMTEDIIKCLWEGADAGNATWESGYTGGIYAWAIFEGVTADTFDDVIFMTHPTKTFEVQILDANNGSDMYTFGQTIDKYDKLPRVCSEGYKVKVVGIDKTTYNDYYVTFEVDNTAEDTNYIGQGVWTETAGFGVNTELDPSKMPHILTREYDDASGTITGTPYESYFLLQEVNWVPREAGDDNTNPSPSFVGTEISDILSYQSRLVLVSEENVVASITFDHYNMFADTVTQESAADPIDTASSDNQVTNLHHALVFNSSLVLLSDRAQFVHPSDVPFSTENFGLSSKAKFKSTITCAPVASASSVFFAYKSGVFTGIHEAQIENVTGNLQEDNITSHVDHYIPGEAEQLESSTDYSMLVTRPGNDPTALYVFQWFNQEGKRQQAAWHKWEFNYPIHHIALLQDRLYIWKKIGTKLSIEYIDLSDTDTVGVAFPIRLDHQKIVTATSDGDYWKVDVSPWTVDLGLSRDDLECIAGEDTGIAGAISVYEDHPTDADAFQVLKVAVFPGEETPKFVIGGSIEAEGQLTNPYVRDQTGKPKTKGVLRLGSIKVNCTDTGALNIIVQKDSAPTYTKEFNTRIIGGEFLLDRPPSLLDVEIKTPIRSDANRCTITFESSSHLPFYISNIDWSGSYYETGRRTV